MVLTRGEKNSKEKGVRKNRASTFEGTKFKDFPKNWRIRRKSAAISYLTTIWSLIARRYTRSTQRCSSLTPLTRFRSRFEATATPACSWKLASELFTSGQILRFPWQDSTYKSYAPFDKLPIQSTNESIDQTDSWGYSIEPVSVRSFLSSFSSFVYPATCIQSYNTLTRVNFVRLLLHVIFESNYRLCFFYLGDGVLFRFSNECVQSQQIENSSLALQRPGLCRRVLNLILGYVRLCLTRSMFFQFDDRLFIWDRDKRSSLMLWLSVIMFCRFIFY